MNAPPEILAVWNKFHDFPMETLTKAWFYSRSGDKKQRTVALMKEHKAQYGITGNCFDLAIWLLDEFKRDGIEVLTNCRVTEVQENQVKLFNKSTKQTQYIPFGMCVWVTGITQVPLVKKMCAKLGNQNNRVGKCI